MKTVRLVYHGLFTLVVVTGIAVAFSPLPIIHKIWVVSGFFGIVCTYIAVAELFFQAKTHTMREFWQPYSTKTFWSKALAISVGSAVLMYFLDQKNGWLLPCVFGLGIGVFAPIHGSLSGSFFSRISQRD